MDAGDILKSMLPMAVALRIMDFKKLPWDQLQEIATNASQFIGEHGDNILFLGPKKGDTAKAFNELTKGIAVLSFAPGGVTLFGLHFEDVHPESVEKGIWLYHSTFADALPTIAKEGFIPDARPRWGGQLADYAKGKIFFTGTQKMAAGYAEMVFTQYLRDHGWSWDPILLRAFSAHLGDVEQDPHSFDDWYVERPVPAVFIQAWVPQKEAWIEVKEAVAQGYFEEFQTKYGEPDEIDVEPGATPEEYAARYIEQFWPKP